MQLTITAAFINMVKDLKENICQIDEQMGSLSREIETIKKKQSDGNSKTEKHGI